MRKLTEKAMIRYEKIFQMRFNFQSWQPKKAISFSSADTEKHAVLLNGIAQALRNTVALK